MDKFIRGWKPVVLSIVVSIAVVVLLVVTRPEKQPGQKEIPPARVELFQVEPQNLHPQEELVGRLQPLRKAQLRFEVAGQVMERLIEPGEKADKGQVLLRLDARDYQNALLEAEAQFLLEKEGIQRDRNLLKLAEKNQTLQEKEVQRLDRLYKTSMVSRSLLDEARQRLVQLESEVARLRYSVESAEPRLKLKKSALDRARDNLAKTRLASPFAGIANKVNVQVGDYVTPTQIATEVVDRSQLDLYLEVRGELAGVLELNQKVQLNIRDQEFTGHIVALQVDPDPATFTHALRIRLPAEAGYPGMMARVAIQLPVIQEALVVPATAMIHEEGVEYVMVFQDGRLERRKVESQSRVRDWYVIGKGLQTNDRVVRRDVAALSAGQSVTIEQEYNFQNLVKREPTPGQ